MELMSITTMKEMEIQRHGDGAVRSHGGVDVADGDVAMD
jgi:hypothetical protein